MKLRSVLAGVPLIGDEFDPEMEITSVSYDSRTLQPGALFVAMEGEQFDGRQYIPQALEKGAAAVLCRERPGMEGTYLITPDPRRALARIACNWFGNPGDEMILVGVTGTNGKTTTTHLIKAMLEGSLHTKVGLIGTNRNMIGSRELPAQRTTPDSYELQKLLRTMADQGCTHVVMEVSSHALVQYRVEGLTFQLGVFTNLTQDHLDYHGTMEDYRAAKERLFRQSELALINLDDEAGRYFLQQVTCPVFTYSENKDCADLTAKNIRLFSSHVEFEAVARSQIARTYLPIPGGFTIYNALAALACGLCLGLTLRESAEPLRCVPGVKGRVEVVPVPTAYTVIIDYAHTPDALEKILSTARDFTAGRLICLFGCGGDRDRGKRSLMGAVAGEMADVAVVTSDNPRTEPPEEIIREILPGLEGTQAQVFVEPDRAEAIRFCLEHGKPGDVIVLAGKGHETYQEIMGVAYPMDEREIVRSYFQNKESKKHEKQQHAGGNIPAGMVK